MKATRREFLKALCVGAVATAINPLNAFAEESTSTLDTVLSKIKNKEKAINIFPSNAELRYNLYDLFGEAASLAGDTQKKALELKGKLSFNSGVSLDMAKKTVDEILAPCYKNKSVVQVEYDSKKGVSNFDRLVYQNDVKAADRMPVLAMFYVNHDTTNKDPAKAGSSKREAIILKNLVRKYKGKIKFVVQEGRTDPKWYGRFKSDAASSTHDNIKTLPSIAMYSPWDVVKGETPKKHDGKVTQVDVLRGAPKTDKQIEKVVYSLPLFWINVNCTSPNGNYTYRFSNSFKLKTAKYS
jgi:hypothetical protein